MASKNQKITIPYQRHERTTPRRMTFAETANEWYVFQKSCVAPSTWSNYEYTLEKLKDAFGIYWLDEITQSDIVEYLQIAGHHLSSSYESKLKSMLIQIYNYAILHNMAAYNPALIPSSRCGKSDRPAPRVIDAFNNDEVQAIWKLLPHDRTGNSIRLMLITGIRGQELLALERSDFNLDDGLLRINKAVKVIEKGRTIVGETKTPGSNRVAPIPDFAKPVIEELLDLCDSSNKLWSATSADRGYSPTNFRRKYWKTMEQLPVRALSPHCCRHTYITYLVSSGVPMPIVAEIVGHTNIRTTQRYCHPDYTPKKEAANKLAMLLA